MSASGELTELESLTREVLAEDYECDPEITEALVDAVLYAGATDLVKLYIEDLVYEEWDMDPEDARPGSPSRPSWWEFVEHRLRLKYTGEYVKCMDPGEKVRVLRLP
jgi:hypothetical protein